MTAQVKAALEPAECTARSFCGFPFRNKDPDMLFNSPAFTECAQRFSPPHGP